MVETTINVKTDSRWFKHLLDKGYLPNEAVAKIESDKRRGLPAPATGFDIKSELKDFWWFYGALGGMGALYLYERFK